MRNIQIAGSVVVLLLLMVGALGVFHWTVNRVYVEPGHSLMLRYKGPLLGTAEYAQAGQFAQEGQVGVLERLRGPGRHFYCPVWWERVIVPDQVVQPGQVAVVTSKLGDALPPGRFLVDGDLDATRQKGILRKVFGPGRYRVNPYAYEFKIMETQVESVGDQMKHSGWVNVPTGYVGVVTYLADDPTLGKKAGLQEQVLPPGLYPVNPREQQVDIVEVGYRECSIEVQKRTDARGEIVLDESGEPSPVAETGINFPSNDGFEIQMDFSAIWGVMPENATEVVRKFGNIDAIETKVIIPQSESICRNNGSRLGAVELLIGESRQQFQTRVSKEFELVLEDKGVTLLYGLVRHIYIPQEVRLPIQQSFVADELKLTREQERETARTEAQLREEEQKVELEGEKIRVETIKLVANVAAEGEKEAQEIAAETEQMAAAIDRQAAEIDAQKQIQLGEAKAQAEQMQQEARADKFKLAVAAFGTPDAYVKWQFAEGLPTEIDLKLFYAGEGTLWTDLKGITPTLPLRTPQPPKQ
ncbi:MAG: SPFH domain-containing protein [Patescibacteria group bacterium]|nr:SPFH domain-containing protein [Patescibacteria group bacterium]